MAAAYAAAMAAAIAAPLPRRRRSNRDFSGAIGARIGRRPPVAVARAAPPPANAVTFSSAISTEAPLNEVHGVSFDEYLRDRPRVFRAMFPDRHRSERLGNDEWRVQMLPLQLLVATVKPVIVLRLLWHSHRKDFPAAVPRSATSVMELQATRWELNGLDSAHMPSHFDLVVRGLLYPEAGGGRGRRLIGKLKISITCVLPPLLALIPDDIMRGAVEAVLRRLAERMQREVDVGLAADFREFRREKMMAARRRPPLRIAVEDANSSG